MIIDTGASLDIIDETTLRKLEAKQKIQLSRATKKLFACGSEEHLPLLWKCATKIETKDEITDACLYVAKGDFGSLMSYNTELNIDFARGGYFNM